MPGFFPRDGTGNPNLMQLTIVQGLLTVVAILAMVTCLLPILRFLLSAMRHGLFRKSTFGSAALEVAEVFQRKKEG